MLTPSQQNVVELVAIGRSNKQIGAQLGLSESTVKWHVSNLLRMFDVSNRAALVSAARDAGFIRSTQITLS